MASHVKTNHNSGPSWTALTASRPYPCIRNWCLWGLQAARTTSKGELSSRLEYPFRTPIRIKVITLVISEKYIRTTRQSASSLVKSLPSPPSRSLIFNHLRPSQNRKMQRRPSLVSAFGMWANAQPLVARAMRRCQVSRNRALPFNWRMDNLRVCIITRLLVINN